MAFKSLIVHNNVNKIYYRIIKISESDVKDKRKKNEYDSIFLSYYIAKPFEKSGAYPLPTDGDYQIHRTEIKLDALPIGAYMILISNNENFSTEKNALTYTFTRVSNISYVHRNTKNGTTDFYILNRINIFHNVRIFFLIMPCKIRHNLILKIIFYNLFLI